MKRYPKAIFLGITGLLIVFFLLPMGALGQSDKSTDLKQSVNFNINGETYMSNKQKPGLMLDLVEMLQESEYLSHIHVSSDLNMGTGSDTSDAIMSQYQISAQYEFDQYTQFQDWYKSEEVQKEFKYMRDRLNKLNMELNMAKRR